MRARPTVGLLTTVFVFTLIGCTESGKSAPVGENDDGRPKQVADRKQKNAGENQNKRGRPAANQLENAKKQPPIQKPIEKNNGKQNVKKKLIVKLKLPAGWKTYTYKKLGFSIAAPKWRISGFDPKSLNLPFKVEIFSVSFSTPVTDRSAHSYVVTVTTVGKLKPSAFFVQTRRNLELVESDAKIAGEKAISIAKHPGKVYTLTSDRYFKLVRAYLIDDRSFLLTASRRGKTSSPLFNPFFQSFRLLGN